MRGEFRSEINYAVWHNAMGREEQTEEREVLDSIFPDEIKSKYSLPISFAHKLWLL